MSKGSNIKRYCRWYRGSALRCTLWSATPGGLIKDDGGKSAGYPPTQQTDILSARKCRGAVGSEGTDETTSTLGRTEQHFAGLRKSFLRQDIPESRSFD